MRNKSRLWVPGLTLWLAALPAMGQKQTTPPAATVYPQAVSQRVLTIPVKYANVYRIREDLSVYGVPIVADGTAKVLMVRGTAEQINAVEKAIRQLDVPPPPPESVAITAYMLVAAPKEIGVVPPRAGGPPALPTGLESSSLPAKLRNIVSELERTSGYTGFRAARSVNLRTLEGTGGGISGLMSVERWVPKQGVPVHEETGDLKLGVRDVEVTQEGAARSIILSDLRLSVSEPYLHENQTIATSADVPEGQDVVVGNTDLMNPDVELFLVVSAKVAN
jgi:hypothetical protein